MKKNLAYKITAVLIPFVAFGLFAGGYKIYQILLSEYYWGCAFHVYTGYHCPGCGATRCILALLNGDIIAMFRYNPGLSLGIFVAVLFYIEFVLFAFGKPKKIVPRSTMLLSTILILLLIFYVLRNFIPVLSPEF